MSNNVEERVLDTANDTVHFDHSKQQKIAGISSVFGSTIEWYDFFLYGTMAAIIFPQLFFPNQDPYVATLLTFTTYAVGYVARPIGGLVFGHYGDKIGRKTSLVATLILMGIATLLIGLLPGYQQVGFWAPVLVSFLRFLQGVAVGGEWPGSVLISMEWGTKKNRGFMAALPQIGVPLGLILGTGVTSLIINISGDSFQTWGWRLPFILSMFLVIIGLVIRFKLMETPSFQKVLKEKELPKLPFVSVFKHYPKQVISGVLSNVSSDVAFGVFAFYTATYGIIHLGLDKSIFVYATLAGALVAVFAIAFSGYFSDKISPKKILGFGNILLILWALPYFYLVNTKSTGLIFLAVIIAFVIHSIMWAPLAPVIAASFPAHLRFSGAAITYMFRGLIGGGVAPLVSTYLLNKFGSGYAISGYIILTAVIALVALKYVDIKYYKED
ncbi:putative integral membrane transport protein [Neobacillus bataviensis LMG 21833]|uniref:Putative proline/betaine transporter n=1 Tax=Neobacillus bataviensis LMG 21833 TaxID=1117379 RepID=K6DPU0_9BACI|nr:MFS transporter [Neobacillus bataviensis]EKN70349.1 putative integral membrane transport protein [Neobacillus bataviensis LMG 21833]